MIRRWSLGAAVASIILFGIVAEFATVYFINRNFHQLLFPQFYQLSFCEELFGCNESDNPEYHRAVREGYQYMAQRRVVFAGLARDIADQLPITIARIESTGKLFKDYRVVVFENDSADNTREILKQWASKNDRVILIDCKESAECKLGKAKMYTYGARSLNRMEKMADFRNRYMDAIQERFSDFDYAAVVDLDLYGPWSNDGIAHSIAQPEWDAIFSYGLHSFPGTFGLWLTMYDGLAYVGKNASYNAPKKAISNYVIMNFVDLYGARRGGKLIPVKSSFSGMALYKMSSFVTARYNANWPCEHIGLHEQMASQGGGKFFINPSLILLSGHQGPRNMVSFVLHRFTPKTS